MDNSEILENNYHTDSEDPETIRRQIDATRMSLDQNLRRFSKEVSYTANEVKSSVDTAVGDIKKQFDPKYQISQHPITALAVGLIGGYFLGSLIRDKTSVEGSSFKSAPYQPKQSNSEGVTGVALKTAVTGVGMKIASDLIRQAIPGNFREHADSFINLFNDTLKKNQNFPR